MDTKLTRRGFLRGIAGITAAGVLLPTEETLRRFWALDRTMAAPNVAPVAVFSNTVGIGDADPSTFFRYDVIRIDDELMWVTDVTESGLSVVRGYAGTPRALHDPNARIDILGVGLAMA